MNHNNSILICGKDSVIVRMSAMSMASTDMNVVVGRNDFKGLTDDIGNFKPAVVLIWNIDNAESFLEFIRKLKHSENKPFFIITASSRRIYNVIYENCSENVLVILEPVSMEFIKDIIIKVTDEGLVSEII